MEFRVLSYIVTFCELDIRKIKSFVLSLYLSSFVLLNQKLNEYNTYEMICFLFFIVSVWIYCINILSKIFKEDSYFDYEYNKSKYLNNTLLKFEGKKY